MDKSGVDDSMYVTPGLARQAQDSMASHYRDTYGWCTECKRRGITVAWSQCQEWQIGKAIMVAWNDQETGGYQGEVRPFTARADRHHP